MMNITSLSFSLEPNATTPLYEQLRKQLLQAIEQGRLQAGDKLPSSRSLALALGVSRSVVMQSYDLLLAEGVLLSQPKRGVFVTAMLPIQPKRLSVPTPPATSQLVKFDSGADVSRFPCKAWAASMRRAWLHPEPELLAGRFMAGYPPLQAAIVDYLYALRGLECQPEQVILVTGNRDALSLLQHALTNEIDQWLLESPTYPPIREIFPASQTAYLPHQEDMFLAPTGQTRWGAVLTPCRQYPLGFSYPSAVREAWLEALALGRGYLIEDDYDNEFLYQGKGALPLTQAASLRAEARDRAFYVGSFSKVMFRGLRLGFIVAPLAQVARLQQSQAALGLTASLAMQPALADFMNNGAFYRHLNKMRRHYRSQRDVLLQRLASQLQTWFTWEKPKGGMHIVAYLKPAYATEYDCTRLNHECQAQGLYLSWLSSHYIEQANTPKGLLLGFTSPSAEQLIDMTDLLAKCCKDCLAHPRR